MISTAELIQPPETPTKARQNRLAILMSHFLPASSTSRVLAAPSPAIAREMLNQLWEQLTASERGWIMSEIDNNHEKDHTSS